VTAIGFRERKMKKRTFFPLHDGEGWPVAQEIESYFLTPVGRDWLFDKADSAAFRAAGADGTGHLESNKGRIDIDLEMWLSPRFGVLLIYSKWGNGQKQMYSSVGDLSRLREWTRTRHNTPMPIGLYIPFEKAWLAVKEFIETDGKLPTSIEWIANSKLPANTFPDP
jgi:hypothetical protein